MGVMKQCCFHCFNYFFIRLIQSLLGSTTDAATNDCHSSNGKIKEFTFRLEQGSVLHLNDGDSFFKIRGETLSVVGCAEESEKYATGIL